MFWAGGALAQSSYDTINRTRAAPPCAAPLKREPLRQNKALERAAALLASGIDLDAALKRVGYHAGRSHVLSMESNSSPAELALLFVKRHCELIADPALLDIGIHLRPGAMTAVLAVPLADSSRSDTGAYRVIAFRGPR